MKGSNSRDARLTSNRKGTPATVRMDENATVQYRESVRTRKLATAETTVSADYPSAAGRGTPAAAGTP